MTLCGMMHPI